MRSAAWMLGSILGCASAAVGCTAREPITPREVDTKACPCGAAVETLSAPADAVPVTPLVAPRPGTRLQQTVSLGYAGDGRLTQIPTRREWWGDRDRGPVAYGGYGYGYGGRGAPRGSHAAQAPSQGFASQGFAAPTIQHGMGTHGGGGPPAAAAPSPGHAPR